MPGRTPTVLPRVMEILREAGTPLPIGEIVERLTVDGWSTTGKNPRMVVGSVLNETVRKDPTGPLQKPQEGVYCLSGVVTPPGEKLPTERKRRTPLPTVLGTCGGCLFIEYNNVDEVLLVSGVCACSESGRFRVRSEETGCRMYRPRPRTMIEGERKRSVELQELISAVNYSAQRRKHS